MLLEGKHIGPAPNWYCSQISDTSLNGLLAYGAQSSLVVINLNTDPPVYQTICQIHENRISAVSFSRVQDYYHMLATGSHDKTVKVFDLKDLPHEEPKIIYELKWKAKIIALDWQMKKSNDLLFILDDESTIFYWNLKTNLTKIVYSKIRSPPQILSACPYNPNKVAIGFKGGIIALINMFKPNEKYSMLKGHDDDILSISWAPNIQTSDDQKIDWSNSMDLASTSRDRTLRIWNILRQKFVKVDKPPIVSKSRRDDDRRVWLTATWNPTSTHQIICSNSNGELFIADIKYDRKPHWEMFSGKQVGMHNRSIFNISILGSNTAVTVSLDRQIILWDIKKMKATLAMPTLGGFCYCMQFSPVDTGRLAIGCGDSLIRTWNTASATGYSTNVFWQGINGKVTQLMWHPERENQLAFGTEEGRVGVLDVLANKPPVVSNTHHRNQVYSLTWGPFRSGKEESDSNKTEWFLYSCGDGKILIHNMNQPNKEPVNFDDFIKLETDVKKKNRSEVSWKPDWNLLAIGNGDGLVEIFSSDFTLLAVLSGQTKLITCLKWHPLCTTASSDLSEKHTWLACSSYENVIQVYDLKSVVGKTSDSAQEEVHITTSAKQLAGHRGKVFHLSWNPHVEGKLASASTDGTAQIWNVELGVPMHNYSGHVNICHSVEWSHHDPDVFFTGSEDSSIHQIKESSLIDKLPPVKKQKPIPTIGIEEDPSVGELSFDSKDVEFDLLLELEKKRIELQKEMAINGDSPKTISAKTTSQEKSKKKKINQKSIFPVTNVMENQSKVTVLNDLQIMSHNLKSDSSLGVLDNSMYLAPFQNYSEVLQMIKTEKAKHLENENLECAYQMDVWKGDIAETLNLAAEKQQLDDFLVSLAMLGSRSLYLDVCEKYATQLKEDGNIHKAATYLLACHKVQEAVELFKERGLFKEAICIAKLRFPPSDPCFQQLYSEWADRCDKDTKYELASKCYLCLNDFENAAKVLAKRMDPFSLKVACHIAATHQLKEAAEGYATLCVHKSLLKNNWAAIEELVNEQIEINVIENVQTLLLISSLHKILHLALSEKSKTPVTNPIRHLLVDMETDMEIWRSSLIDSRDYSSVVSSQWLEIMPDIFSQRKIILRTVQKLFSQQKNPLNQNELYCQFAINLTLAQLSENDEEFFKHVCVVLSDSYNLQPQFNVLRDICLVLAPSVTGSAELEDKSLIKGLDFIETISNFSYKECSPQSSCCAFFLSCLLDQIYGQSTNLPLKLLNHTHGEENYLEDNAVTSLFLQEYTKPLVVIQDDTKATRVLKEDMKTPVVSQDNAVHQENAEALVVHQENAEASVVVRQENAEASVVVRQENAEASVVVRQENAEASVVVCQENAEASVVVCQENAEASVVVCQENAEASVVVCQENAEASVVVCQENAEASVVVHQENAEASVVHQENAEASVVVHQENAEASVVHQENAEASVVVHQETAESSVVHQENAEASIVLQENAEASIVLQENAEASIVHQENAEASIVHQENAEASIVHQENAEASIVHQENAEASIVHQENAEASIVHQENAEASIVHQENAEASVVHQENAEASVVHQENAEASVNSQKNSETPVVQEENTEVPAVPMENVDLPVNTQEMSEALVVHQENAETIVTFQDTTELSILQDKTKSSNLLKNNSSVALLQSDENSSAAILHSDIDVPTDLTKSPNVYNQSIVCSKEDSNIADTLENVIEGMNTNGTDCEVLTKEKMSLPENSETSNDNEIVSEELKYDIVPVEDSQDSIVPLEESKVSVVPIEDSSSVLLDKSHALSENHSNQNISPQKVFTTKSIPAEDSAPHNDKEIPFEGIKEALPHLSLVEFAVMNFKNKDSIEPFLEESVKNVLCTSPPNIFQESHSIKEEFGDTMNKDNLNSSYNQDLQEKSILNTSMDVEVNSIQNESGLTNLDITLSSINSELTPNTEEDKSNSESFFKLPSQSNMLSYSLESTLKSTRSIIKRNSVSIQEEKCVEVTSKLCSFLLILAKGLSNQKFKEKQRLEKELNEAKIVLTAAITRQEAIPANENSSNGIEEHQLVTQKLSQSLHEITSETKNLVYPELKRTKETFQKLLMEINKKVICAKAKNLLFELEREINVLLKN